MKKSVKDNIFKALLGGGVAGSITYALLASATHIKELNKKDEEIKDREEKIELQTKEIEDSKAELQNLQKANDDFADDLGTSITGKFQASLNSKSPKEALTSLGKIITDEITAANLKAEKISKLLKDLEGLMKENFEKDQVIQNLHEIWANLRKEIKALRDKLAEEKRQIKAENQDLIREKDDQINNLQGIGSNIRKKLKEQEQKISELETERNQADATRKNLTDQLNDALASEQSLQNAWAHARNENKGLKEQVANLKNELEKLKAKGAGGVESQEMLNRIQELEEESDSKDDDIANLKNQLDGLRKYNQSLQDSYVSKDMYDKSQQSNAALKKELEETKQDLEQSDISRKNLTDKLNDALASEKGLLEIGKNLREENKELRSKLNSPSKVSIEPDSAEDVPDDSDLDTIREEITKLMKENDTLKKAVNNLNTALDKSESENNIMKGQIVGLLAALDDCEEKKTNSFSSLNWYIKVNQDLVARLNKLTGTGKGSIHALEKKIKELECKIKALEAENQSLTQTNDSLQNLAKQSAERIGELTIQQKPDCEDIESLRSELESLRKQLEESRTSHGRTKRNLEITEKILSAVDKDRNQMAEQKWDQLNDYIYNILGYATDQSGCNPLSNDESDAVGLWCSSMNMFRTPGTSGNGKMSVGLMPSDDDDGTAKNFLKRIAEVWKNADLSRDIDKTREIVR